MTVSPSSAMTRFTARVSGWRGDRKTTTSPLLTTAPSPPLHSQTATTSFRVLVLKSVFRNGYIEGPETRIRVKMYAWKNQIHGDQAIRVKRVRIGVRMRRGRVWILERRVERLWMEREGSV